MEDLSPKEKLDAILAYLREHNAEIEETTLLSDLKVKGILRGSSQMYTNLSQLETDGYVQKREESGRYPLFSITYKGHDFLGYVKTDLLIAQEKTKAEAQQIFQTEQDDRLEGLQRQLTDLTRSIARGTIAAALIALLLLGFQIYCYFHPQSVGVVSVKIAK
jgi:Fe2+ or Zn2+ uptake regulation protein